MALNLADELDGLLFSADEVMLDGEVNSGTLGAELAQALESDGTSPHRPTDSHVHAPRRSSLERYRTPIRRRSHGARTAKSTPESFVTAPSHLDPDVSYSTRSPSSFSFSPGPHQPFCHSDEECSTTDPLSSSPPATARPDGFAPARLFSPHLERGALDELLDSLNANSMFISLLEMTIKPPSTRADMDERIQNHLHLLQEQDKKRERELEALELLNDRLGHIDWDPTTAGEMSSLLKDVLQEAQAERFESHWRMETPGAVTTELDDPFLHIPATATSASSDSASLLRPLLNATDDLVASFGPLLTALHESHSLSIPIARQMRNIRAAVEDFKAREEHEQVCRLAIDDWESKRLHRGLQGQLGTKERLGRDCQEFEKVLEDYGQRLGACVQAIRAR